LQGERIRHNESKKEQRQKYQKVREGGGGKPSPFFRAGAVRKDGRAPRFDSEELGGGMVKKKPGRRRGGPETDVRRRRKEGKIIKRTRLVQTKGKQRRGGKKTIR